MGRIRATTFPIALSRGWLRVPCLAVAMLLCFSADIAAVAQARVVTIGVYDNRPMAYLDPADGLLEGVFISIIDDIAKSEGWTIEYRHGSWAECLSWLEAGEIDLLADIGWSEERTQRFDFTEETVLATWAQIYTHPDSDIVSLTDLDRKRVACMVEDVHYPVLQKLVNDFDLDTEIAEYSSYDDVIHAVMNHDVDAALLSRVAGLHYEAVRGVRRSPIVLSPIKVLFATPKGKNADLRQAIDTRLRALKQDQDSAYYEAIDRWMGDTAPVKIGAGWRWALGISITFAMVAFIFNQTLRARVRAQTGELEEKNIALELEIAERRRAEDALRSSEDRLRSQNAALSQLAQLDTLDQNVRGSALKTITELAATTLGVERASVWLFDQAQASIVCIDLFERIAGVHSSGTVLTEALYPSYFRALKDEHTIAAHDARTDPRTCEFTETYLDVIGITSMLDAPIRVGGRMIGVLCNEHIGAQRYWLIDEQNFAGSLADFAALIIESGERLRAEDDLRRNEEYFRSIINNSLDAVVTMDMQGKIIGWNPQAERTFGWHSNEAIGQDLGALIVPPSYRQAHDTGVQRYVSTGEKRMFNRMQEMSAIRRDGQEFPIELTLTSAHVRGNDIVTAFIRDVTERKRAEIERQRLVAIQQELDVASRIQQSILPREFPQFAGALHVDIYATMIPAKEVAGDFYDYFAIDDHRLGFVIGDVSGKGVPAAIFMASCRTLLKAIALDGDSPAECLDTLNGMVHADNVAEMFVTLAYGMLDTRTGDVTYSLAGHPAAILMLREGSIQETDVAGGTILGVFPNIRYTETKLTLNPGDGLFLYTDGVTESMDIKGRLFGDERLKTFLATHQAGLPVKALVERLLRDIQKYEGDAPRHDDTTVLAIRYRG